MTKKHIILFCGANKYQIDQEINQIIHKMKVDELNLSKYNCDEVLIDDAINDCETLTFFGDQKVVIVNNPVFLGAQKSKLEHNIDQFIKYIENPNEGSLLIINCFDIKMDKKRKVVKALLNHAEVYNYDNLTENEAIQVIKDRFHSLQVPIRFEAINELILRTECDAHKLYSELDKIAFYLNEQQEITVNDIKLLVTEPLENNIFNLTNNIIEGDISSSIKIYHKLLRQNEEPILFAAILAKNLHNIYLIKEYQKKGFNEYQLKNILKIHPYQLKKLYQIAFRTDYYRLVKNIHALSQYDIDLKTGKVDKNLGFELFILNS